MTPAGKLVIPNPMMESKTKGNLSPKAFDFMEMVKIFLIVVLGGLGSISGCIVGAFLIVFIEQWLAKQERRNRVDVVRPESEGAKRAVTRWRVLDLIQQKMTGGISSTAMEAIAEPCRRDMNVLAVSTATAASRQ